VTVVVRFVVGQQFPAGSIDEAARSRWNVVKVIKRSSDDCKTTQDNE